jgi:CubicO group peptidase (beta-lactamase class C family)
MTSSSVKSSNWTQPHHRIRSLLAGYVFRARPGRSARWVDTPGEESSSGRYFSESSIGHLSYAGTSLWIDPERKLAVVLLTNRTWPDRANNAIQEVRPALHDALAEGMASRRRSCAPN